LATKLRNAQKDYVSKLTFGAAAERIVTSCQFFERFVLALRMMRRGKPIIGRRNA
jgi:hypothetical protein